MGKVKRLKPLGRKRYGNPDLRVLVPDWSISKRAVDIMDEQAVCQNASKSFLFETMVKNIMVLSHFGLFDMEIDNIRGRRGYKLPKINIHPTCINFLQNYTNKSYTSATVSSMIECYYDDFDFELNLLKLL